MYPNITDPPNFRVLVISDALRAQKTASRLHSEGCFADAFPLRGIASDLTDGSSDWTQGLRDSARHADIVLLEWDTSKAPLFGIACYTLRHEMAPLVASCGWHEDDHVVSLLVGADIAVIGPPSLRMLRAVVSAHRRRPARVAGAEVEDIAPAEVAHHVRKRHYQKGALIIMPESNSVSVRGRVVELPPRQIDFLVALAESPNGTLSRDELLNAVWGIDFDTGTNLVDVYVHRLRSVLSAYGAPHVIQTVRGRGYRFVPLVD